METEPLARLQTSRQRRIPSFFGRNAAALALGDLNNDGSLDLIASHDGGLAVLLGNGDGTFRSALQKSLGTITLRPFTADFNGDGNLDLVTGFISVGSTRAGSRIAVLLGLGDGTFGAVHTFG